MSKKSELLKLLKDEYLNGRISHSPHKIDLIKGQEGLCCAMTQLAKRKEITGQEYRTLIFYLEENEIYGIDYKWHPSKITERIEWLDEHIKLTKKDERIQK